MSYTQDLIDEFKKDGLGSAAEEEAVTEQHDEGQPSAEPVPEETPSEQSEPEVVDNQPEPEPDKDTDNQPEPEPEKEEPKPEKPDLSQIPKEEKAKHAFLRQMAKKDEKHKAEIEELKKSFQSQFDEFKASVVAKAKQEEPEKTRDDFPVGKGGDDAYIQYLSDKAVDKRLAEHEAEVARQAKEKEEAERKAKEAEAVQRETADMFNRNARNAFGDGYGEFEARVNKGIANGLAEVLDEAPAVRDYIFHQPDGPTVLNEMLENKEAFVRVMSRGGNPMAAILECHDLAKEIAARKAAPVQPQPRTVMPSLGKPGSGGSTRTAPDIFHDESALMDFIRKRRHG